MQAAALRIGNLLNQSELGRDIKLSAMTVHRYLNLLETSYKRLTGFESPSKGYEWFGADPGQRA